MNIFSRLVIYKIICDSNINDVYIGSTVNFKHRVYQHRYNSKKSESKLYQSIRKNGGFENYRVEIIEEFPCLNSIEARSRERFYYDMYNMCNPLLNSISPNKK